MFLHDLFFQYYFLKYQKYYVITFKVSSTYMTYIYQDPLSYNILSDHLPSNHTTLDGYVTFLHDTTHEQIYIIDPRSEPARKSTRDGDGGAGFRSFGRGGPAAARRGAAQRVDIYLWDMIFVVSEPNDLILKTITQPLRSYIIVASGSSNHYIQHAKVMRHMQISFDLQL